MGYPLLFSRSRHHLLTFVLGCLLVSGAFGLASLLTAKLDVENTAVRQTLEAKDTLDRILSLVQDAETAQRGYLLTGNDQYLEPYRKRDSIATEVAELRRIESPEQRIKVDELEHLAKEKLSELATTIERRRAGDTDGALAVVRTDAGKTFMDRIRLVISELRAEEDRALVARQARATRAIRFLQAGIIGLIFLIASLAVTTVVQMNRRARKLAAVEAAARDSEARYRLLAENATDMIVLADLHGVRRYVSPASRELIGYEPEALINTHPGALMHPEDVDRFADTLRALREGLAERATSTHRAQRKDGAFIWVETQFRLLRDSETGLPSEVVSAVRDVTERHRQGEELQRARETAEAGARAKGDFLASMSHEFRTPLNAIIGFSGLMLESGELQTAPIRRYAHLVQEASKALLSIVNDVLDVSKMEAGSLDLDPRPFSPGQLIEDTAELVRAQAEAKGIALEVVIDPALPPALIGDDARLRQVVLNLLSNAVKFTAKGFVRVAATSEQIDNATRARVRFEVVDTGIGIPRAKRHRLFKRFSQVDSSTSRQFGGTGLGLSICKSLVEIMGGTIEVESVEGRGSAFSFVIDLPLADRAVEAEHSVTPLLSATKMGLRILLAEDIPVNQELAVALLTKWGYRVDVAPDGAAALDAVRRTAYDLVLMDVQMPVMDGVEATRRIRALGGTFATLPILAITANVLADDVANFRAAGMTEHVRKPFVPKELLAAIERHGRSSELTGNGFVVGSESAEAAPAVILDHNVLNSLWETFGSDRMRSLLTKFEAQLGASFAGTTDEVLDRTPLLREAHSLASTAGAFGFRDLSEACRDLEEACQEGANPRVAWSDRLSRMRQVKACAQHELSKELISRGTEAA